MANNRGFRKQIVELKKRIETLENQDFAKQLLIDELYSTIRRLENSNNGFSYNIKCPVNCPHPSSQLDYAGNEICTSCGVLLLKMNVTCNSLNVELPKLK